MRDFGYRNENRGLRFIFILMGLLVVCVVACVFLMVEITNDFKANNPGKNEQQVMGETSDSEDEDSSDISLDDESDNSGVVDNVVNLKGDDGKLIVVIDAGHDSTHTGTYGDNVYEDELVLEIAKYCYEELLTYEGIEVYMTREGEDCPNDGITSAECNSFRVKFAEKKNADAYISLHLNALGDTSFGGAIVYYPNANYIEKFNTQGEILANLIMDELVGLGLTNRGVRTHDSQDGGTYPDGTLADYYGVIRGSKEAGIMAVIIEHAYLTCVEDVKNHLSTDEQLKALGIADATAIAEYYGLEKK